MHCGRLQPVERGFEPVVVARAGAAADEGQDFVGRCRHQAGRLQSAIASFNDLRSSPDQDVGVPDRRHAVLRNGFDTNGDLAGAEVDRNGALGLGEREEGIGHEVLRVAWREIAGKRAKQIKLLALRGPSASHRRLPLPCHQRRARPAYGSGAAACRLAGNTVPAPGSEVEVLEPRSAHAFRSSSA